MKNDILFFSKLPFMCMTVFIMTVTVGSGVLDGFLFWHQALIRKGGECLT